jgi:tetratricopeptide (TPR) repeat protein
MIRGLLLRSVLSLVCLSSTVFAASPRVSAEESSLIDHAFTRLYNFDFPGAHSILDEHFRMNAADPVGHALRGAVYLFTEFDRLKILQTEFFADDDKVTDKKKLKPDPAARDRVFAATAEARKFAAPLLKARPNDRDALFAMALACGAEMEYTILVEKKYLRSYGLSKESQGYARRLLALDPPFYDAYVTLGAVEYVVSNLNFLFRLFAKFDGVDGNKQRAIDNLRKVVSNGRYYPPFAKILLAVIHLREKRHGDALALLRELERDYPDNPLYRQEIASILKKSGSAGTSANK